jgi:hypothetical protein
VFATDAKGYGHSMGGVSIVCGNTWGKVLRKQNEGCRSRGFAAHEWILLAKSAHPIIHDAILQTAEFAEINPKNSHDVMTAHQAVHLVVERMGITVILKPDGFRFSRGRRHCETAIGHGIVA